LLYIRKLYGKKSILYSRSIVGSPKFEAVSLINKFTEYDTKKIHL